MPASNQWLKLMARNFTPQTQIVLGYSGYDRTKGWLHKRTAFDTLFQSLRYLGFALAGKPYMGIGRNLAYRKELFFQQKGFSKYLNLQRGEDDLYPRRNRHQRHHTDKSCVPIQRMERGKNKLYGDRKILSGNTTIPFGI